MKLMHNLDEQINALPKEHQPPRDLFPGIARRLQRPTHKKALLIVSWAMSIVISTGLGLLLGHELIPATPTKISVGHAIVQANFELQKQQLFKTIGSSPAVVIGWQDQLRLLEEAVVTAQQLLAKHPNDPELLAWLQQLYQQQLWLIKKVHLQQI